jgi:hypothetical protein
MASTKEMQARAKSRKHAGKRAQLNGPAVVQAVLQVSKILVKQDPRQDYTSSDMMVTAAREFITHPKNGLRGYSQELSVVAREFDKILSKKYDLQIASGVGAFMQDLESHMKERGVPQEQRVALGLFDLIGGMLVHDDGHVKFVNF